MAVNKADPRYAVDEARMDLSPEEAKSAKIGGVTVTTRSSSIDLERGPEVSDVAQLIKAKRESAGVDLKGQTIELSYSKAGPLLVKFEDDSYAPLNPLDTSKRVTVRSPRSQEK